MVLTFSGLKFLRPRQKVTEAKEKIWTTDGIYWLDSYYNLYGELPHFYPYNTSPVRKAGLGESHSFLCLRVRLWPGSSHSQTSILNTLPRWLPFCYERGSQGCCKHSHYKGRETTVPCNVINVGISEFNFFKIFFFERNSISNFFFITQNVTPRNK